MLSSHPTGGGAFANAGWTCQQNRMRQAFLTDAVVPTLCE